MSASQSYPYPQAFMVDCGGGQSSMHPPGLVPCWSFPPAQERLRTRRKGSSGISCGLTLGLLFLLLLVFAALGLGAYQVYKLQTELAAMQQEIDKQKDGPAVLKQVGPPETEKDTEEANTAVPAAHVTGGHKMNEFTKTLRWEPQAGRAFTSGGVVYQDGGLQVNKPGLYQVYSRVEFLAEHCSPIDHSMFLRRQGQDIILMDGFWAGYCSSGGQVRTFGNYLSGAVWLQKHDWVYVNVSQPDMVTHHHYANFFGLYKI